MWYGKESETFTLARCSFCGKRQDQVTRLTPGTGHLCICNECVDFCREIVEQGHPLSQWREWQTGRTEPTAIIEPIHTAYEAIRRTVLEYIEGIEAGDPNRIERSIHADLKTKGFLAAEEGAQSLITLTFTELLELRNASPQKGKMPKAARTDMLICDRGRPNSRSEAYRVVGNRLPASGKRSGALDNRESPAAHASTGQQLP